MTLTISTQQSQILDSKSKSRSGHFANNEVSDEYDVVDKVALAHGIEGVPVTIEPQPSTVSDAQQKFDASLSKLFGCIKLAYKDTVKMTAPKIRAYKGVKMSKKDKIRLNNIVWRDWHEQFVKHKKPSICQFTGAASFEHQHKEVGDLLEGQYWKRRIEVIKREYMKWRVFNKAKIKGRGEQETLTSVEQLLERVANERYQVTHQHIVSQESPESLQSNEEIKNDMTTNDIFESLQLIGFHHNVPGGASEFLSFDHLNVVQPSLVSLEPELEFGELDTAESFQDMLAQAVNLHMGNINTYLPGQKRPFNENVPSPPTAAQQYISLEPPPPYNSMKRSRSIVETDVPPLKPELENSMLALTTQPQNTIQAHSNMVTQSDFMPVPYTSIPQTFTSMQSSLPQQAYADPNDFVVGDRYVPNFDSFNMQITSTKITTTNTPHQMNSSTGHHDLVPNDDTSLQDLFLSAFKDGDECVFKPPEPPAEGSSRYVPQLVKHLTQSSYPPRTTSSCQNVTVPNTSQDVTSTDQFKPGQTYSHCPTVTSAQSRTDYSNIWTPTEKDAFFSPSSSSVSSFSSVQTPTTPDYLTTPKKELMSPTNSESFAVPHSTTESTSEQRRRQAIKNSFNTLTEILPNVSSTQTNKASNAQILIKAQEFITQQTEEQHNRQSEIEFLKQEVDALTSAISISQGQLPITGIPAHSSHHEVMKKMFHSYVNDQIKRNWKFYIFSKMAEPMFNSFCPAVNSSTVDELYRSSQAWLDQHCNLPAMRGSALQAMRDVSGETSILSQPSALPEQARNHVLK